MATNIVDLTKTGAKSKEDLPANTTVFHVDYEDPTTGLNYGGDFTVKRLNIGEVSQVAIRKAQMNGGLPEEALDRNMVYLHSMLSHLALAIRSSPDWWKPNEFFDATIIQDVYKEVMQFEDSFRRPMAERSQKAESDSKKSAESKSSHAKKVVDKEV